MARRRRHRRNPDRCITITYDIVTPESAEHGDVAESGWVDEDGVDMELDEWDIEEEITSVDKAVKYLQDEGATEPSEWTSRGDAAARWWTSRYQDPYSGDVETRSYHLEGFTDAEKKAIYREMMR